MVKIYVEDNYLFYINEAGTIAADHAGEVFFLPTSPTLESYQMISPKLGKTIINVTDTTNKAGTSWTVGTFETFYKESTGFNPATGGSVAGALRVIGFWNADTNTPDLSALSLTQGESYQVSVSGSTSLNGETNWKAKDLAVWSDGLAGNWFKLDNTDDVLSVNGSTGVVVLTASDIGLSNVDNTSDANKPISTATQTALDGKKDDFAESTAFNKNFGTTAGTVLEGDTAIGDMFKSVYDPTGVEADAFDYGNAIGITQITGTSTSYTATGTVDDYDMGTSNYLYVDMSSDEDWTGFVAPPAGVDRIIRGVNVSDKKIKFQNNDSGSAAANRLLLKEYANKDCKKGEPFAFKYDHISDRWRPFVRIG